MLGTSINTTLADSYFIGGALAAPGRNVDDGGVLSAQSVADMDTVFVGGLATQTVAQLAVTPGTMPVFDGGQAFNGLGELVGTPAPPPPPPAPPRDDTRRFSYDGSWSIRPQPYLYFPPSGDPPEDGDVSDPSSAGESAEDGFVTFEDSSSWWSGLVSSPAESWLTDWNRPSTYSWNAYLTPVDYLRAPTSSTRVGVTDWRGPVAYNANHVIFDQTSVIDTRYRADTFVFDDAVALTDLTATSALQTPEPGSAGLVAAGVLVWGLRRSRRAG